MGNILKVEIKAKKDETGRGTSKEDQISCIKDIFTGGNQAKYDRIKEHFDALPEDQRTAILDKIGDEDFFDSYNFATMHMTNEFENDPAKLNEVVTYINNMFPEAAQMD